MLDHDVDDIDVGATSFENLRTVDGVLCPTCKQACRRRGLRADDREGMQCLTEASAMRTGSQLQHLFAIILMHCGPEDPFALWHAFKVHLCDDLSYSLSHGLQISDPTEDQVYDYDLHLIDMTLYNNGKCLWDIESMPVSHMN